MKLPPADLGHGICRNLLMLMNDGVILVVCGCEQRLVSRSALYFQLELTSLTLAADGERREMADVCV